MIMNLQVLVLRGNKQKRCTLLLSSWTRKSKSVSAIEVNTMNSYVSAKLLKQILLLWGDFDKWIGRLDSRAGRQCINFLYRVLAYEFIWEKIRKKSWRKNVCSITNRFLRILTFVNFTHINSKKIQLVCFLTDFDETTFKEYCSSRRFRKWGHMSKSIEK